MEEMPNIEPIRPMNIGRFARGTIWTMMTLVLENMPADPAPAMARPTMNATEFGVAPHNAEPISKIPTAVRKTALLE